MWLFHLHSAVKNRAFFQFSPWRDPRLRHFSGYPFGVSRKKHQPFSITQPIDKTRLCLSLWLIQDSNWKGRVLWKLSGGLATILQNWISCNEQKMREAHITRRGINFYLLIFIEKIINRKIEHSLPFSF
ncbi:hypothetical protein [Bilophila sp.]|uniref:hypothetical protein n=1 Tax=Bilophila sp. TaxID=1929485 RepID=UPI0030779008